MKKVTFFEKQNYGYDFIPADEYHFRNMQNGGDENYRKISRDELKILYDNGNHIEHPDDFLVSKNGFNPKVISNNKFYGKIRIGKMKEGYLRFHDLELPVGISGSVIISSDIGDYCAIHNLSYLSHYIIKQNVIIHNVFEMQTTNHSKFGNGILKEGEDSSVRIELNIMNENEGRSVFPFDTMLTSDAYIWGKFRDRIKLIKKFEQITDNSYSHKRGWYGVVDEGCVIKGTRIIKDVMLGPYTYVKGADKLKNLTIKSILDSPSQIGEGVALVNGIIGPGSRIFYGVKAVRFVCGENTNLKYGARLINSFLGDNSTISCCEVISNLIFPFHEQHHNNSFLISSTIKGQSNMAAGANIGSNHNSRGPDGEMVAGRGFWPALSSTIKFDSYFASYTLIAKGNYPYEINLKLPFCLLTSNRETGCREIMPGYWWLYNMYATERNSNKFLSRDKRILGKQHIVTEYLAPDSVNEIWEGINLILSWTMNSYNCTKEEAINLFKNKTDKFDNSPIYCFGVEKSKKPVKLLKPQAGYNAYWDMLIYYGIREIIEYCYDNNLSFVSFEKKAKDENQFLDWENIGGQLVPRFRLEELFKKIENDEYKSWNEVHDVYDKWWSLYNEDKAKHALKMLHLALNKQELTIEDWNYLTNHLIKTRKYIDIEVKKTKEKDYNDNFRQITYSNTLERDEVIGRIEENSFVIKCLALSNDIINKLKNVNYS